MEQAKHYHFNAFLREKPYWKLLAATQQLEEHHWPRNMPDKDFQVITQVVSKLREISKFLYLARQEYLEIEEPENAEG